MIRFMKVSVPAEGYAEISRIGNLYVVHLDGVQKDDMIECYEYITEDTPDVSQLQEDLVVWKNYIAEKELLFAKEAKCKDLLKYDSSDAVNRFDVTIDGQTMNLWIDRETRADYRSSIEAAELLGRTEVKPVFAGMEITLPIQTAKTALAQVQLYANQCYGVTEQHKAAINALETVEAVEAYDFSTGYPERLTFEI